MQAVKILVKSSGDWLICEHSGRPLALPLHDCSRSTDQKASRPGWLAPR